MPALRYSEDTEFNDALRARGILPSLAAQPESPPPEPPRRPGAEELIDRLDDKRSIDGLELDDQLPTSLIDHHKSTRLAELRRLDQISHSRSTGLKPIGRQDYLREVNEASQLDLDPHSSLTRKGTGVVVCLWNKSIFTPSHSSSLRPYSNIYFLGILTRPKY